MRLKAWIVDAPAGGCCMQIIEQEGVKPELLTHEIEVGRFTCFGDKLWFSPGQDKTISANYNRTAQSVIDQITAGLAGHAVVREPKRGDWVNVGPNSKNRIFLCVIEGADRPVACVSDEDQEDFLRGSEFRVVLWNTMRPIAQPVRYSRSGDIHTWTTEAE